VVERRQASARRFARAAPLWRGPWTTRLSAFRFPFRHCEQREAIQSSAKASGGNASGDKALDCFVASLLAMTNILAVFQNSRRKPAATTMELA
jgi:hypothetical protein